MELNRSNIEGKWNEIKGEMIKAWGKLTNDELEKTKGDITAIKGLIQQKYGEAREGYQQKINSIIDNVTQKKDEVTDSIKENLKE